MRKYIQYSCKACLYTMFTPRCLAHSSLGFWYRPSVCGSNGTRAMTADGQGFPGKWVTSEIFWLLRLESQPGKLHARSLPHGWDWWGNCVRFPHHSCLRDVTWMVIWFRKEECKKNNFCSLLLWCIFIWVLPQINQFFYCCVLHGFKLTMRQCMSEAQLEEIIFFNLCPHLNHWEKIW